MRQFSLFCFLSTLSSLAIAQYTLYDGDEGQLTLGAQLQTALFGDINNQSGGAAKTHLSDTFWELTAKPRVDGQANLAYGSQLYGGFSYVYSSTLNHDLSGSTQKNVPLYQQESDFLVFDTYNNHRYAHRTEELFLGWKSGKLLDEEENVIIDMSGGKQNFKLGSGFLLHYGADNGGRLGAGWINPRTAFTNTRIGRLQVNNIKLEGFQLETRPLNPAETKQYRGGNIEYTVDSATLGLSYINTSNHRFLHDNGSRLHLGSQRTDNDTLNVRLDMSPLAHITLSTEYAYQRNTTKITTQPTTQQVTQHASGGFGQIEYKRQDMDWQPALSYRYAIQGEHFDAMSPGFSTWGTWFQGEISGEWMLDNTNLSTHVGKIVLTPQESVTLTLLYYHFSFVNAQTFAIAESDYGHEVNILADWNVTETLSLCAGLEAFMPGAGGNAYLGGDANKTWLQGMLSASFEF